jgi:hypothetical protein
VIFFVHNAQGFAHCLYTGLYAIQARPDAIIAFDDWQVKDIFKALEKLQEHDANDREDRIIKPYIMDIQVKKYKADELRKYRGHFIAGTRVITSKTNKLLLSAFQGGDISKVGLGWDPGLTYTYDPNPYHLNRTPENDYHTQDPFAQFEKHTPESKVRAWNFASLLHGKTATWLKRQGCTWPVSMFGQRKGENKTARLTEDEMCYVFHSQWGSLMPGYPHAGSGWWRARPLQVADAGSMLLCDEAEGKNLYGPGGGPPNASYVEELGTTELAVIAAYQKDAFYELHRPHDKRKQREAIERVME